METSQIPFEERMQQMYPDGRLCRDCQQVKPLSEFYKRPTYCKKCVCLQSKRRQQLLSQRGKRHTAKEWRELCAKYEFRCLYCGEQKPLTKDHVVPVIMGGGDEIENIQPLCAACNTSKWGDAIDFRPDAPPMPPEYKVAILQYQLKESERKIKELEVIIERQRRDSILINGARTKN